MPSPRPDDGTVAVTAASPTASPAGSPTQGRVMRRGNSRPGVRIRFAITSLTSTDHRIRRGLTASVGDAGRASADRELALVRSPPRLVQLRRARAARIRSMATGSRTAVMVRTGAHSPRSGRRRSSAPVPAASTRSSPGSARPGSGHWEMGPAVSQARLPTATAHAARTRRGTTRGGCAGPARARSAAPAVRGSLYCGADLPSSVMP